SLAGVPGCWLGDRLRRGRPCIGPWSHGRRLLGKHGPERQTCCCREQHHSVPTQSRHSFKSPASKSRWHGSKSAIAIIDHTQDEPAKLGGSTGDLANSPPCQPILKQLGSISFGERGRDE